MDKSSPKPKEEILSQPASPVGGQPPVETGTKAPDEAALHKDKYA